MCIIPILAQITQRKKMQDIFDPRIKNIFLETKKLLESLILRVLIFD